MKSNSLQENNDLKNLFPILLVLLSLAGWAYFLFLWFFLGYKWELFPLEIPLNPRVLSFVKLPLFFKVCCCFIVLWWHLLLFNYKTHNRLFYASLSLVLALGLISEQFIFVLNPVKAYRNALKVDLKAKPLIDHESGK